MLSVQIIDFQLRFKNVLYLKAELHRINKHIASLTNWDKNGSHNAAILRAMDKKRAINHNLKDALGPKTYEQWSARSRKITNILAKKKMARKESTKQKWAKELELLEHF